MAYHQHRALVNVRVATTVRQAHQTIVQHHAAVLTSEYASIVLCGVLELSCVCVCRYCPSGSGVPRDVPIGFYSTPLTVAEDVRSSVSQCGPGSYCTGGLRSLCAGGTFSTAYGRVVACVDVCRAGYFCPMGTGTLSVESNGCLQATAYCPEGSSSQVSTSEGFYALVTSEGLYFNETECEAGYYCVEGIRTRCPAGRYGDAPRGVRDTCVGNCTAGYYCAPGSASPTQHLCGSITVYCPPVSTVCVCVVCVCVCACVCVVCACKLDPGFIVFCA